MAQQHDTGVQMHPGGHSRHADSNVGSTDRLISVLGGGLLALYGLRRQDVLGLTLAAGGGYLLYRGATGRCPLSESLGVSTAEEHGDASSVAAGKGVRVSRSITIDAPAKKLYEYWRDLSKLPKIMDNLESVTEEGDTSHWVGRGPMGYRAEWDAKLITEKPCELLAWQSIGDGDVDTAGSVHFSEAPGGRGTEVRVVMKFDPPAGKTGYALAKLFGKSPEGQLGQGLGRLKQLMETGEIATA